MYCIAYPSETICWIFAAIATFVPQTNLRYSHNLTLLLTSWMQYTKWKRACSWVSLLLLDMDLDQINPHDENIWLNFNHILDANIRIEITLNATQQFLSFHNRNANHLLHSFQKFHILLFGIDETFYELFLFLNCRKK